MDNKNRKYERVINRFRIDLIKLTHGYEEETSYLTCGSQLTMKLTLIEYRQYETQKSENNIPDQFHKNLGPQIVATGKIIHFLNKQVY